MAPNHLNHLVLSSEEESEIFRFTGNSIGSSSKNHSQEDVLGPEIIDELLKALDKDVLTKVNLHFLFDNDFLRD